MLSPLKLVVALCAVNAAATDFKCWKASKHRGPVSGVYTLTTHWQNAPDCGSAKWVTGKTGHCIQIRGSKDQKAWNGRTTDFPTNIFKDVGWNSQVREVKCGKGNSKKKGGF